MSRRILCFGDSNTYGYDPRSPLGERYPETVRWTGRLRESGRWEVRSGGENGREIPHSPWACSGAAAWIEREGPPDGLAVMLGSNDLLQLPGGTAEQVTERMERFLRGILAAPSLGRAALLLTAPPPMRPGAWVAEERLLLQSARLGECYGNLARRLGIAFADAGRWDVELAFDGVHFTEAGHRAFARGMERALEALFRNGVE